MTEYEQGVVQGFAFALHCLPGRRLEVTKEMLEILNAMGPMEISWYDDMAHDIRVYSLKSRKVVKGELVENAD